MSDVLLVNLPIQNISQSGLKKHHEFNPSLGLIYLASFLEFNGREARICDLIYEKIDKNTFIDFIEKDSPSLIAISAYTENIEMAVSFSKVIKQNFPNIKVAIGGPHVSLSQKEFYENNEIDFIMKGEGESVLLELTEAILSDEKIIKYEKIEGIEFRKEGKVFKNEKRGFIKDLDLLPIPKREIFDFNLYKNNVGINISTSRGCPSGCIYCSATALSGAKYRVREIDNVFLEMVMLEKLIGPKDYFIVDDSFTIIRKRIDRFLDLIKTYQPKFTWSCESLANHMDEELLERMSENHCTAIQYGIESGNKEVLKKIHKPIDLEHAKKIIEATAKSGIMPVTSFIIGHYCDTEESVRDTINFIKELKKNVDVEVGTGFNTPFPGTNQFENREDLGIKIVEKHFKRFNLMNPVMETDNFTVDDQMNWMYEIRHLIYAKAKYLKEIKEKRSKVNG